MKKQILLIDESLTVQKVVALTLDRERYTLAVAKTRPEAMKLVLEAPPDVILVSDQVSGLTASSFPKEVETWVGRDRKVPALILISAQSTPPGRGYGVVLKKPFSPQSLQQAVNDALGAEEKAESRVEKAFTEAFADESRLVEQTLNTADVEQEAITLLNIPAPAENAAGLWGGAEVNQNVEVMGTKDSLAYKASLEKEVRGQLENQDLERMVQSVLERIVPPMVERLAQQRLDALLKESESFVELKP